MYGSRAAKIRMNRRRDRRAGQLHSQRLVFVLVQFSKNAAERPHDNNSTSSSKEDGYWVVQATRSLLVVTTI